MKINIGCGRDYRKGWINYDISPECVNDGILDISKDTLPHEDGSVIEIYISGVLEQIGENQLFQHAMNECWRVLVPGGTMTVVVPNAKYAIAHRDPMDIRKFTPETFSYFLKTAREWDLYGSIYGFKGWSEIRTEENARHILTVTMIK